MLRPKTTQKSPKLIKESIKDVRQILENSTKEVRTYKKESNYIYKPKRSRFKIKFWFTDGNEKTFFSYDSVKQIDNSYIIDEWIGLDKLVKLAIKWQGKFKTAIIFMNPEDEPKANNKNYNICVMKIFPDRNITNKKLYFNQKGIVNLDKFKVNESGNIK